MCFKSQTPLMTMCMEMDSQHFKVNLCFWKGFTFGLLKWFLFPKKTLHTRKFTCPLFKGTILKGMNHLPFHIFSIDMLVFGGQPNLESNMSDTKNSDVEDSDLDIRGNVRGKNSPLWRCQSLGVEWYSAKGCGVKRHQPEFRYGWYGSKFQSNCF